MFTADRLLSLLDARPFVPFRVIMSDGGHVDVPTFEIVFPLRQFAIVMILEPGSDRIADRWMNVWYMHVTRVEMLTPGAMPFTNPPTSGSESPTPVAS